MRSFTKPTFAYILTTVLSGLMGCAHHSPAAPVAAVRSTTFEIPSMGTIWHIEIKPCPPEMRTALKAQIVTLLARYESTFSDWVEDSELRRLEKHGLTIEQHPSELMMSAFRWSDEACKRSQGAFDITIGAVVWKVADKPVGCHQLQLAANSFRFKLDPKRLTFDGIVKGAAVTAIGRLIRETLPLSDSIVNAGGGNLFLSASFSEHEGLSHADHTISHSFSLQGSRQHIFDPQAPDRFMNAGASALCELPAGNIQGWERLGALADVLSKTAIVKPNIDFGVPSCRIYKHRGEQ